MRITEIRCSKLARPMSCSGSLFFTDIEEKTNDAAREGTAFGELLAHKLLGSDHGSHASNGVPFNADMHFYSDDLVPAIKERADQSEILCEQKINWVTSSGIRIMGSSDITYASHDTLYIDDAKYGWSLVNEKENWQLLGYAIGEVIRRQKAFKFISMRILQPRPHHEDGPIREWRITYDELLGYKERIEKRMLEIANGDDSLVTGSQCKYCPAAPKCPALNKAFYRGVELVHEFVQDNVDNKELSFQLDLIKRIEELVKIKKDSIEELAKTRIAAGQVIPNYVAIQNYSDRKWKDCVTPEFMKQMTGKDIIKQEMLSPRQAELAGVPKELVAGLVEKKFIGQKLVRKDHNELGNKIFGKKEG